MFISAIIITYYNIVCVKVEEVNINGKLLKGRKNNILQ